VIKPCFHHWMWAPLALSLLPRPMSNLLTPPGLCRCLFCHAPPNIHCHNPAIEPLPARLGAWVSFDNLHARPLLPVDFGCSLGIPKHWDVLEALINPCSTTSVFHWELLSSSFTLSTDSILEPVLPVQAHHTGTTELALIHHIAPVGFDWTVPDLSPGGTWHQDRVRSLTAAAALFPNSSNVFAQGFLDLDIHQTNYGPTGSQVGCLRILWWEYPC
jgi:hypothetical protein